MDMGIRGRKAIVEAASKGLGKGCAMMLAEEGCELFINARTASELEATADEIRKRYNVNVTAIPGDITKPEVRSDILKACPEPDILVTNAGGPAPGNFRTDTRERWLAALEAQLLSHVEMITAVIDGMTERKFGRIVNITSQSVKMPVPNLGLSTAARMALTGFSSTICREVAPFNVTINGLLPGPFDTDRLRANFTYASERTGKPEEELKQARREENPSKRFGTAEEFGATCAFLCSVHAGFITGQNILMDGGHFPANI
jgi:3-oxoacyl-[acyl-carrier protein] reductase